MGNKISINLTQDIINCVKLLKVQRFSESLVGYDTYALYPDTNFFEIIAMVLGLEDHKIAGTEENAYGALYDEEATKKIIEVDEYIVENLESIEEILHQFCETGIKPGKYSCLAYQRIWKYDGEPKKKEQKETAEE